MRIEGIRGLRAGAWQIWSLGLSPWLRASLETDSKAVGGGLFRKLKWLPPFEIGSTRGPSGSYMPRIKEQENVVHEGHRDRTEGMVLRADLQRQERG